MLLPLYVFIICAFYPKMPENEKENPRDRLIIGSATPSSYVSLVIEITLPENMHCVRLDRQAND